MWQCNVNLIGCGSNGIVGKNTVGTADKRWKDILHGPSTSLRASETPRGDDYWGASGPCGAVFLGFLRGLTGLDACLLVKEGSSSSTSMSESEFGLSLWSESERGLFLGEEAGVGAGWE